MRLTGKDPFIAHFNLLLQLQFFYPILLPIKQNKQNLENSPQKISKCSTKSLETLFLSFWRFYGLKKENFQLIIYYHIIPLNLCNTFKMAKYEMSCASIPIGLNKLT